MSWTILLFKVKIEVDLPYSSLLTSIRGKSFNSGSSFRLSKTKNNQTRIFYSYQQRLDQRIGYFGDNSIEVIIRELGTGNRVTINFKYNNSTLIAVGLISTFILVLGLYIYPNLGLLTTTIILLTIYLGLVVNLNSQLYYFKSDLEKMEESYKNKSTIKY